MKNIYALLLLFLSILAFLLFNIGTTKETIATTISILLFSFPGIPIYRASFRCNVRKNPTTLFMGALIGFSLSCFVAIIVGYFIKWDVYVVSLCLLITGIFLHFLQKKIFPVTESLQPWEKEDYFILLFCLVVVVLSICYPFLNVGKLTNHGHAYAHLFGHDFILRVSFSASLAHGIPPDYLNFTGYSLPTYWLFYVFPAFVYLFLGPSSSLQNITLITQVFCALLFTAILFSVLRNILKKRASVIISMLIGLCAYSYYDLYVLFQGISERLPEPVRVIFNKYGLTEFSGLSHSIFRDFLLEPQAILVLSLILVIIILLRKETFGISDWARYSLIGLLMAFSMGIDAFIGIIIVLWCAVVLVFDLFEDGRINLNKIFPLSGSLIAFSLVFLCYYLIHMYALSESDSGIIFKPYKMIILLFPIYYLLEFGPAFIFGILGAITWRKIADRSKYAHIALLACITLFISLLIRHNIEINLGIRKGGYVLYIPLIIFSGIFFDHIFSTAKVSKKVLYCTSTLLILSIPTLFTDINAVSNITDQKKTTYVSIADFNACQWIKKNTPSNAIVQSEPEYPSPYEYSLIPDFAERAVIVSESKRALFVRIPDIKDIAEERKREIRFMFSEPEVKPVIEVIKKYGINYVYLGTYEQKLYPAGIEKFDRYSEYFKKVYDVEGVRVYKFISNRHL